MAHPDSSIIVILSPRWSVPRSCAFVYRNGLYVRACAFHRMSPIHVR